MKLPISKNFQRKQLETFIKRNVKYPLSSVISISSTVARNETRTNRI